MMFSLHCLPLNPIQYNHRMHAQTNNHEGVVRDLLEMFGIRVGLDVALQKLTHDEDKTRSQSYFRKVTEDIGLVA